MRLSQTCLGDFLTQHVLSPMFPLLQAFFNWSKPSQPSYRVHLNMSVNTCMFISNFTCEGWPFYKFLQLQYDRDVRISIPWIKMPIWCYISVLFCCLFFFFLINIFLLQKKKNQEKLTQILKHRIFFLYKTFKLFYLIYHKLHLPSLSNGWQWYIFILILLKKLFCSYLIPRNLQINYTWCIGTKKLDKLFSAFTIKINVAN